MDEGIEKQDTLTSIGCDPEARGKGGSYAGRSKACNP